MNMKMKQLENTIEQIIEPVHGRISIALEWEGEEITIHSQERCEAASLIKIPILLESFRQHQEGKIDLGKWISVPSEKRVGGAGVLNYLSANMKLTLKDLLTLMIIVSDNTAANLIIDLIGMDSVNRLCEQLGCHQTSLQRALFNQYAIKQGKNNYTSAHDMLICLRELAHGPLLNSSNRKEIIEIMKAQQLANKLPNGILQYDENDPILAHKTGEVHGVEHDIGIIRYQNQEILLAVLTYDLVDQAEGRKV
ncbi:MAG TPA: serine hydrolase, partial [Bacillales bacterium]|nr:serine hydrolase [Bacillales bacterium]